MSNIYFSGVRLQLEKQLYIKDELIWKIKKSFLLLELFYLSY